MVGVWFTTVFFLVSGLAFAEGFNPRFNLQPQDPALEGRVGVVRVYKASDLEVHLKSVTIPNAEAAQRALQVNFEMIRGLYAPKKNPYAGEITALVQCDKKFKPDEFTVICPDKTEVKGITGGVGARRAFGMCSERDIHEVGAFFSCYDPAAKRISEVRVFVPFQKHKPWSNQVQAIEKTAKELLR